MTRSAANWCGTPEAVEKIARGIGESLGQTVWPPVERAKSRALTPYDLKELDAGCLVELEHTNSRFKACKIALDHLREDPRYYSKLCTIWPKERGCEHVRRVINVWPAALIVAGLGIAAFAVWRTKKAA
jgi:hypothetical protein